MTSRQKQLTLFWPALILTVGIALGTLMMYGRSNTSVAQSSDTPTPFATAGTTTPGATQDPEEGTPNAKTPPSGTAFWGATSTP